MFTDLLVILHSFHVRTPSMYANWDYELSSRACLANSTVRPACILLVRSNQVVGKQSEWRTPTVKPTCILLIGSNQVVGRRSEIYPDLGLVFRSNNKIQTKNDPKNFKTLPDGGLVGTGRCWGDIPV